MANFKVLHLQVGPFPQKTEDGRDFIFSMDQFKALHPCDPAMTPADYYPPLIERLLDLKAIEESPLPAVKDSEIPTGPHNRKSKPLTDEERRKKILADREKAEIDKIIAEENAAKRGLGRPKKSEEMATA